MKTNVHLCHGSPTRGPRVCIIRPAATFVNYVHTIKLNSSLGRSVHHLLAAREPALCYKKFGGP